MIFSHIVAMSQNRVIGAAGKLPWHLPEDLRFFKEKTKNHIMIMGRKTFESLPGILPSRMHIVISRNPSHSDHPMVKHQSSLELAAQEASALILENPAWGSEVFIIGGGEIFRQSLNLTNKIYLTDIDCEIPGDVFYPEINTEQFRMIENRPGQPTDQDRQKVQHNFKYSFLTFERV